VRGSGTISLAIFVIAYILLNNWAGPVTCKDGWASPSIGRQGACSWHGGVDRTRQNLAFWGSVLLGFVAYELINVKTIIGTTKISGEPHSAENEDNSAKPKEPACPLCGKPMVPRLAKRGRNRGNLFFGCSRYPACRGTRNIKDWE
jgi:hypothetical protein